jgi:hypothetical protein
MITDYTCRDFPGGKQYCSDYCNHYWGGGGGSDGNPPVYKCDSCAGCNGTPGVNKCEDWGGDQNFCSEWCNTEGKWDCGTATDFKYTCSCNGCNGCDTAAPDIGEDACRTSFKGGPDYCADKLPVPVLSQGDTCPAGYYSAPGSVECKHWTNKMTGDIDHYQYKYFPNGCKVGETCEWIDVPNSIWVTGDMSGNIPTFNRMGYNPWNDSLAGEKIMAGGTSWICQGAADGSCYCDEPNPPEGVDGFNDPCSFAQHYCGNTGSDTFYLDRFCATWHLQAMMQDIKNNPNDPNTDQIDKNETLKPGISNYGYCTNCKMEKNIFTCDCPAQVATECKGYDGCSGHDVGTVCPPGAPGAEDSSFGYRCVLDTSVGKIWEAYTNISDWNADIEKNPKSESLNIIPCLNQYNKQGFSYPLWKKLGFDFPPQGPAVSSTKNSSMGIIYDWKNTQKLECAPLRTGISCPSCSKPTCNGITCDDWDQMVDWIDAGGDLVLEAYSAFAELQVTADALEIAIAAGI